MYTPKPSGPLGANSLQAVPVAAGTKDWRLTLLDPARSAFDAALTSTDKTSVTLAYSGAQVGSNEYLSAVLMDNGGNLTYYGRVKALETMADASGHIKINIPANIGLSHCLVVAAAEYSHSDSRRIYIELLSLFLRHPFR